MCDTFVYVPTEKSGGNIIFGKNSDREPNEAQAIIGIPAKHHANKTVKCTYIEIPQVSETHEVLLSKPFWMWGAEMGVNEYGLTIGNEAVFTKIKINKKQPGLSGMDLIRLALERSKTADTALELITSLIDQYGQDANGGYKNKLYYHNSFIISDKNKAWVLETAGKHWVAVEVKGFRSISNRLSIGEEFDLSSKGIEDFALKNKLIKKQDTFHFARAFSDWFYTYFSKSARRYAKTCSLGAAYENFSVADAQKILSTHFVEGKDFNPTKLYNGGSVCMHATDFSNPTQTVGSMIAEIRKDTKTSVWFTGTSNPCISVYKPFFFGGKSLLAENFTAPTAFYDQSFWWQAEKFHRRVMQNYHPAKELFNDERLKMQNELFDKEKEHILNNAKIKNFDELSFQSIETHTKAIHQWFEKLKKVKPEIHRYQFLVRRFYRKMNRQAKIHF